MNKLLIILATASLLGSFYMLIEPMPEVKLTDNGQKTRQRVMMKTCFHEGIFQRDIYGCDDFAKEIKLTN